MGEDASPPPSPNVSPSGSRAQHSRPHKMFPRRGEPRGTEGMSAWGRMPPPLPSFTKCFPVGVVGHKCFPVETTAPKCFPVGVTHQNVSPSGANPTGQHMGPRARRGNMKKCFPVEAMEMFPGHHPDGETCQIQKSAVFTPTRKHIRTCLKYVSPLRLLECFPVEPVAHLGVTAPTGKHFPK